MLDLVWVREAVQPKEESLEVSEVVHGQVYVLDFVVAEIHKLEQVVSFKTGSTRSESKAN